MEITAHWSVSGPTRLGDYHVEFGTKAVPPDVNKMCQLGNQVNQIPWPKLELLFLPLFKNYDFSAEVSYGTWHNNTDPRDGSPNIEVAALCMEGATTTGSWGPYPFTYAHFWFMAGVIARICYIKGIDTETDFDVSVEPDVLQNGPIYVISTHGERAIQTNDDGEDTVPELGYFIYSGDGNCRWDLACKDQAENSVLSQSSTAVKSCRDTAALLRARVHAIKQTLNEESDLWGLDKDASY